MNLKRICGIYSTLLGILVISLWIILLITNQVPELATAPLEMIFLLTTEIIMATTSIIAGIGLLKDYSWSSKIFYLAMGLVLYSVINAAGYNGNLGDWMQFCMFIIFAFITFSFVILSLNEKYEF